MNESREPDVWDLIERGRAAERRLREGDVEAVLELAEVDMMFGDHMSSRPTVTEEADKLERDPENSWLVLKGAADWHCVPWEDVQRGLDDGTLLALDDGKELVATYAAWDRFMEKRAAADLRGSLRETIGNALRSAGVAQEGLLEDLVNRCAVTAAAVLTVPSEA